jgi:hypothetical protein
MRSAKDNFNNHTFKDTTCAIRGCNNQGTNFLRIVYVDKSGWFCDKCTIELEQDELVALDHPHTSCKSKAKEKYE